MRVFNRQISRSKNFNRYFSSEAPKIEAAASIPPVAPAASSSSSSFTQRLTGFLVGCGVGFSASFYLIAEELKDSNAQFEKTLKSIEERVKALEKK